MADRNKTCVVIFCDVSLFGSMLLGGLISLAIFLLRKGELIVYSIELRLSAFVSLPHCAVVDLQFQIVAFPGHNSLAFYARNFEKVEGAYCFGIVRVCACECVRSSVKR